MLLVFKLNSNLLAFECFCMFLIILYLDRPGAVSSHPVKVWKAGIILHTASPKWFANGFTSW